ncbi:ATP-binding protein [Mesorhizobium sp. M0204]|uniref:ATP-binding protein n=1 Tax=Mesorhizobium sp. M0204 TaxID=2956913 RepID=UPI00333B1B21
MTHCIESTALPAARKDWTEILTAVGITAETPVTGCCGMAGMFGHKARHGATSKRLFNLSWAGPLQQSRIVAAILPLPSKAFCRKGRKAPARHPRGYARARTLTGRGGRKGAGGSNRASNAGRYASRPVVQCLSRKTSPRYDRKLAARLRFAKLRHQATPEDIDYGSEPASTALCSSSSSPATGSMRTTIWRVGKSWLACALGHKACRDDRSVLYQRLPRLFANLALARGHGRYARFTRKLGSVQLLILDDWGLEQADDRARHDLLEILEDRYGRRSAIVTSQLPVSAWHEVIGNPTYADAILDRLVHNAHRIDLTGESLRRKQPNKT